MTVICSIIKAGLIRTATCTTLVSLTNYFYVSFHVRFVGMPINIDTCTCLLTEQAKSNGGKTEQLSGGSFFIFDQNMDVISAICFCIF